MQGLTALCGTVLAKVAHGKVGCPLHPMETSGSSNRPPDVSAADAHKSCRSCGLRVDTCRPQLFCESVFTRHSRRGGIHDEAAQDRRRRHTIAVWNTMTG
jgi:hypothetical protein